MRLSSFPALRYLRELTPVGNRKLRNQLPQVSFKSVQDILYGTVNQVGLHRATARIAMYISWTKRIKFYKLRVAMKIITRVQSRYVICTGFLLSCMYCFDFVDAFEF